MSLPAAWGTETETNLTGCGNSTVGIPGRGRGVVENSFLYGLRIWKGTKICKCTLLKDLVNHDFF